MRLAYFLIDKISVATDDKELLASISIDLSKVFDTLDHRILITKYKYKDIHGIMPNWFLSYLTYR